MLSPSSHPLAPNRHRELQNGALGRIGGRPQPAAMRLDNPAADCQPQAQAVRLGRIEGIEQPVETGVFPFFRSGFQQSKG